ncbi:MAG: thermonuclease family protein [Rickettsiales bacterium]|nr:thermonuclease family protein [Rickettsiales bacterium]
MTTKLVSYDALMQDIRGEVFRVEQNISRMVTRQKVEMSWKIGKAINDYLIGNATSGYGQKLFEQLSVDVGLNARLLYQMSAFHKKYPQLPRDDGVLNWSHYRGLISVEDDEKRKSFEKLAIDNQMGAVALQREISQDKIAVGSTKIVTKALKLNVTRGELFHYNIVSDAKENKKFVDCGFNIFSEVNTPFDSKNGILRSVKKDSEFTFATSDVPAKRAHTYKAVVDKVVDGDTLRVSLDLGFKIRHKEILRLAKINAPERGTTGGTKASDFVCKIIKNLDFVVIKTNKTDIYGRYVADVFFLEGEKDVHKVASEGQYLSQLLVDEGLANIM